MSDRNVRPEVDIAASTVALLAQRCRLLKGPSIAETRGSRHVAGLRGSNHTIPVRRRHRRQAGKLRKRLVDRQQVRRGRVLRGNPIREGDGNRLVRTRTRVHLLNGSETVARESVGDAYQRRPQPAVYQVTFPLIRRRATTSGEARTSLSTR